MLQKFCTALTATTVLSAAGCYRAPAKEETTVAAKLETQLAHQQESGKQPQTDSVDYLAYFDNADDAAAHAKAVAAQGGTVANLNEAGTLQRAAVASDNLDGVTIARDALTTVNTQVNLVRPELTEAESLSNEQAVLEALTVRKVTGVDRLAQRFPEADGRNVKVAVFDSGIDFGVEGVSKDGKLAGFYDLTGFGKVATTALTDRSPAPSYSIDGLTLALPAALGVQRVLATGTLSEAALANAYDIADGVDLNGNTRLDDAFPFVLGANRLGVPAVFIDLDRDGTIALDASEELTDFNTTHKWLDLYHGAPSGARPLAVTIDAATNALQFHSVPNGHGTSCAVIIAGDNYGDGRLSGMAPKATLYGYVLDADGQDFYTIDQYLAMFVHAKAQGVDAISISWGFSTADLESSRFVADFLDREIASAGIVIGIAAGNAGPGLTSAAADDYIPRNGFGVGALISAEQALNVYGWSGAAADAIVGYSSVGPTRGGRLIPDAASPLMSFVRGERGTTPGRFYAFSGTSSATPALIGSVSALMSALKQAGEAPIDARLLKLAVQQTTRKLPSTEGLRQGAGVIDVAAAYDTYRTLAAELKAARLDSARRTKFAYELRAETPMAGLGVAAEGVVLNGAVEDATVTVKVVGESVALIDPLTTLEPMLVRHAGKFFTTPAVLPVQANGGRFTVQFNRDVLKTPGVYSDIIELARPSDGLVLLRLPVVVTVDAAAAAEGGLVQVDQTVTPFDVWRAPIVLAADEEIAFDGVTLDLGGNSGHNLQLQIYNELGHSVGNQVLPLTGPVTPISFRSARLPAGRYELLINRSFGRPAALGNIKLSGAFRLAKARIVAAATDANGVGLAVMTRGPLDVFRAELEVSGFRQTLPLNRGIGSLSREGYLATVALTAPQESLGLALRQSALDRIVDGFLHVELVLRDADTGATLYRGWHDLNPANSAPETIALSAPASRIDILAYPNIVHWATTTTKTLTAELTEPLATPITLAVQKVFPTGNGSRTVALRFDGAVPANASGDLRLFDAAGKQLETLRVFAP